MDVFYIFWGLFEQVIWRTREEGVILWSTLSLSPMTHFKGLVPQIIFISDMINRLLNIKNVLVSHVTPSLTFFTLFRAITMYQDWGFQASKGLKSTLKEHKCISNDLCTIFLVLLCEAIQQLGATNRPKFKQLFGI